MSKNLSQQVVLDRRGFVAATFATVAGLGLAGCSGSKTSEPAGSDAGSAKASSKKAVELQVFAANSLEKALPEVQELYTEQTGTTFAENALIKAETICKACGLPTIADDSGLCVDALDGAPGIYSARYCEGTDEAATATTKPTTTSFWTPCRLCLPGSGVQNSCPRCASSCRMGGI